MKNLKKLVLLTLLLVISGTVLNGMNIKGNAFKTRLGDRDNRPGMEHLFKRMGTSLGISSNNRRFHINTIRSVARGLNLLITDWDLELIFEILAKPSNGQDQFFYNFIKFLKENIVIENGFKIIRKSLVIEHLKQYYLENLRKIYENGLFCDLEFIKNLFERDINVCIRFINNPELNRFMPISMILNFNELIDKTFEKMLNDGISIYSNTEDLNQAIIRFFEFSGIEILDDNFNYDDPNLIEAIRYLRPNTEFIVKIFERNINDLSLPLVEVLVDTLNTSSTPHEFKNIVYNLLWIINPDNANHIIKELDSLVITVDSFLDNLILEIKAKNNIAATLNSIRSKGFAPDKTAWLFNITKKVSRAIAEESIGSEDSVNKMKSILMKKASFLENLERYYDLGDEICFLDNLAITSVQLALMIPLLRVNDVSGLLLRNNALTILPDSIRSLTNLRFLYLSRNAYIELDRIPNMLGCETFI